MVSPGPFPVDALGSSHFYSVETPKPPIQPSLDRFPVDAPVSWEGQRARSNAPSSKVFVANSGVECDHSRVGAEE